jgi:UDP-GlcNAc:undecaprenyl-phosphate GlcNAc-1-phosphate transferase
MAIFRRWVRNLPLSAADRRHVHHLLIGLGLDPRQAALLLYCFSGFLCGAVMLGVALRNEYLTLILGTSGCLVFLLVVTSRRDELSNLRDDLQDRLTRRRQERQAAKLAWEAIQRVELATEMTRAYEIVDQTAQSMGCEVLRIACDSPLTPASWGRDGSFPDARLRPTLSGPSVIFRLSGGQGLWITVSLGLPADSPIAADIVFRYLQRLCQALAERLARFQSSESIDEPESRRPSSAPPAAGWWPREASLLTAIFARVGGRSTRRRGPDASPMAAGRAAAEALASRAAGTRG